MGAAEGVRDSGTAAASRTRVLRVPVRGRRSVSSGVRRRLAGDNLTHERKEDPAAGSRDQIGSLQVDDAHHGSVPGEVDRINAHGESFPDESRPVEERNLDGEAVDRDLPSHVVPAARLQRVVEDPAEFALEIAPSHLGHVDPRTAQREAARLQVRGHREAAVIVRHQLGVQHEPSLVDARTQVHVSGLAVDAGAERDVLHLEAAEGQLDGLDAGHREIAEAHASVGEHDAIDPEAPARLRGPGMGVVLLGNLRMHGGLRGAGRHQPHHVEAAVVEAIDGHPRRLEDDLPELNDLAKQRQPADRHLKSLPGDQRRIAVVVLR